MGSGTGVTSRVTMVIGDCSPDLVLTDPVTLGQDFDDEGSMSRRPSARTGTAGDQNAASGSLNDDLEVVCNVEMLSFVRR